MPDRTIYGDLCWAMLVSRAAVLVVFGWSVACSSSSDEPTTAADTGGGAEDTGATGVVDTGSGKVDTGEGGVCTGLSGTYDCTRKRSMAMPGSCSPTLTFAAAIPVKITADTASASGYKIEVGYSDSMGTVTFVTCTNNVSGCTIFATCLPSAGTDQVTLTIDGNNVSGTIKRENKMPECTVNFDVTGTRK